MHGIIETPLEAEPDRAVRNPVARRMAAIAEEVAAPAADDVDQQGRFPSETIAALQSEGLLTAMVPVELGGLGAGISEVSEGLVALGRQCASSAMVVAMHHIQVACLVRHGRNELLSDYLVDAVAHQYLLASDAVLVTARRTADSPESDQVLVLCRPPELRLEQVGEWNALGFRGTCSPGFVLEASGDARSILDDPYSDISTRTMLPVAHILWSSLWLGIATAALDRARRFVQAEARKRPGTTPTAAMRLADTAALHQQFADMVHSAALRYEEVADDPERSSSLGFAIAMNSLKVSASTLVVDVVRQCMVICGLASYRLDGPFSLGRHLRDSMGASLMVNNDRIMANNAQLLLVHRGE